MHRVYRILIAFFCMAFIYFYAPTPALAAAGDVLSGEYVLIVNTDLSNATEVSDYNWVDLPQSSGTIYFDASARNASGSSSSTADASHGINTLSVKSDAFVSSSGLLSASAQNAAFNGSASYTLGQVKSIGGKSYTLASAGEHCFIWMDDAVKSGYINMGLDIASVGAAAAAVYDECSYPVIRRFDATDLLYYADGSDKLSILFEANISSGYFDYSDMFLSNGGVTSIHINIKLSELPAEFGSYGPLFAHECQHALNYCMESTGAYTYMDLWLNEALSVAAMDVYTKGHDGNNWLSGMINTSSDYLGQGRSFVYSSYPGYTEANYSMPFLFLRYLNTQANRGYERQGDFYSSFYQANSLGDVYSTPWRRYDANRIEYVLRRYAPTADWDFRQALINFYIAIQVQANDGAYGFYGDPIVSRKVSGFPIYNGASGSSVDIEKCGAIMVKTLNGSFTVPSDAGKDIVFVAFSPSLYSKGLTTAGTEDDPHIISNAEELSYIWDAEYNRDHFLIVSDFEDDPGYYNFWSDNFYNYYMDQSQRHWPDFYGVLDGDGYTINNLAHPISMTNYGFIKGLNVNCNLALDSHYLGAIAGMNKGTIEDCAAHGQIVIPDNISSYYDTPYSYAWIGGIAGEMREEAPLGAYPLAIRRCMSDVIISGELDVFKYFYIGGILGSSYIESGGMDLEDCFSSADFSLWVKDTLPQSVTVGGLVGANTNSNALTKNCYSVSDISFTNENGGSLEDKYYYFGRFFGRAANYSATYQNLYSLSGFAPCGAQYTPPELVTANADSMRLQSTFSGFDFNTVWQMPEAGSEYPYPLIRAVSAPMGSYLLGDVSRDGHVSVKDAVILCRHIAGIRSLSGRALLLADVNRDGFADVVDLLLICRYVAGSISSFAANG